MWLEKDLFFSPFDFDTRFIRNFTGNISSMGSSCYFIVDGRHINAKSTAALLGAGISENTKVEINVLSGSEEQAKLDLKFVKNLILGDER